MLNKRLLAGWVLLLGNFGKKVDLESARPCAVRRAGPSLGAHILGNTGKNLV